MRYRAYATRSAPIAPLSHPLSSPMRRSSFFTRAIFIGVMLHVYVGLRIVPELPVGTPVKIVGVCALICSCFLIPLSMLVRRFDHRPSLDRIAWIGLVDMGLFSSLLVFTILRDVVLASALTIDALWPGLILLDRWRTDTAAGVVGLAILSTLIGFVNARRRAKVVSVDVPIEQLPAELDGLTIVQISDIHVGPTIKARYVDAIVDAVNRLDADIIAVTGDIVDGSVAQLAGHTRPLGRLTARYGAYLVTGNHEYYSGATQWIAEFERLGLRVLLNEHIVLEHNGAKFIVAGVTDFSAGQFDETHRSDPAAALDNAPRDIGIKLLLAHQPRSALAAAEVGYTLQLSGHTHGGQFFPWNFFVRLQQPFTAGLAKLDSLWIYTSRGTGYWGPPKRLGAPSEITRLRLVGNPMQ